MRVDDVAGNGPGRYYSPCHRMPFHSTDKGSTCVSVTRETSARPYLKAYPEGTKKMDKQGYLAGAYTRSHFSST
jgi:hypothetical protein